MIDTAQIFNRTTDRLTTGEGHVVRHGDVRRVRKVFVGSPASRTLRGQPPVQTSLRRRHASFRTPPSFRRRPEPMGQLRRTETVRNRLTQKPTTKPLPQPVAKAQTQEPQRKKPRTTTARASTRVYNPNSSFPASPVIPANAGTQRKANLAVSSPLPLSGRGPG